MPWSGLETATNVGADLRHRPDVAPATAAGARRRATRENWPRRAKPRAARRVQFSRVEHAGTWQRLSTVIGHATGFGSVGALSFHVARLRAP